MSIYATYVGGNRGAGGGGGVGGANTALSNLVSVAINADLLPDSVASRSLGSLTLPWLSAFSNEVRVQDDPTPGQTLISPAFVGTVSEPTGGLTAVNLLRVGGTDAVTAGVGTAVILVTSGSVESSYTGDMLISTGDTNSGPSTTGAIDIRPGYAVGGASGTVNIHGGDSDDTGTPGNVVLIPGRNDSSSVFGTVQVGGTLDLLSHSIINASVAYSPGTPSSWSGTPPTTVAEALDRLAALEKVLNLGVGP